MKYRSRIDLAAEVLSATLRVGKKTRIMNLGNLNFKQLNDYMKMLIAAGLLTFNSESDTYSITERGRKFLVVFKSYRQHTTESEKKMGIVAARKFQLEQMCHPLATTGSGLFTVGEQT